MIEVDDRWCARRIPDDFITRSGEAPGRISEVVKENWWCHDRESRTKLAQALVPILKDLLRPGTEVTDEHRDLCEGVVFAWLTQVLTSQQQTT
jgi:hypothetical protein